ncbi:pYEATS domain-containing protein [Hymenobacter bucti]|uniref:PYEATS domain-containing protein n=1 Tax=Hymenobacter bucti TaxID=1844114 RepID=A0ABW4QZC4_9BACT
MEPEIDYKNNSRTASIVTAIGALLTVVSIAVILIINEYKSRRLDEAKVTESLLKKSAKILQDSIKILKPSIEPFSYAVPTGKVSYPGVSYMSGETPEFAYYIGLNVADSLKSSILTVDYFFDHPTFKKKHQTSNNAADSFRVSYRGWGCLDNVLISISKSNGVKDTLNFKMCSNLKLKGQSIAVH